MPEPIPTAMMEETGIRPRSEWTVDNPATREEIEAELEKYRGRSLVFSSWGGAYQSAQRQAYLIPFNDQFGIEVIEDSQLRSSAGSGPCRRRATSPGTSLTRVRRHNTQSWEKTGSLEDLDFSVIDNSGLPGKVLKAPYTGGGGITWSETWAYNSDVVPRGQPADNYVRHSTTPRSFPGLDVPGPTTLDLEMKFVILLLENPELLNTSKRVGPVCLLLIPNRWTVHSSSLTNTRDQIDPDMADRIRLPAAPDKRRSGHVHQLERTNLRCRQGRRTHQDLLGMRSPHQHRRVGHHQGPERSGPRGLRVGPAVHGLDFLTGN